LAKFIDLWRVWRPLFFFKLKLPNFEWAIKNRFIWVLESTCIFMSNTWYNYTKFIIIKHASTKCYKILSVLLCNEICLYKIGAIKKKWRENIKKFIRAICFNVYFWLETLELFSFEAVKLIIFLCQYRNKASLALTWNDIQ
jgi:hypothetical protein